MQNATSHATSVLYMMENRLYSHEPVSRAIAVTVAVHGKYSRTKTMRLNAQAALKYGNPVAGLIAVSLADSELSSMSS